MPDDVLTQAVTAPAQAAGNGTEPAGAGAQVASDEAGEAISLDEARKLRREAQTLRKRLADYEGREQQAQAAALTEAEKLQKRVAELETTQAAALREHQEKIVRYEVMLKAASLGVIDPDAAVKLLDWATLEFDEDGTPTNLEKALRDLLKAKPYLLKPVAAPAPNINAGAQGTKQETDVARVEELKKRFRLG